MRFLPLLFAVVALALAACEPPPEFSVALSEPGEAAYDDRLRGFWSQGKEFGQPGQGTSLISAQIWADREAPDSRLNISLVFQIKEAISAWLFKAHASRLDGGIYYNLLRRRDYPQWDYSAPDGEPGWIIARPFFLSDDLLMICVLLSPQSDAPEAELRDKLSAVGLTPRFAQKPLPDKAGQIDEDSGGFLHSYVATDRDTLVRLVQGELKPFFEQMYLFHRLGGASATQVRDAAYRQTLLAALERHRGDCNLDPAIQELKKLDGE